jgi:hypothetical protein
MGPELLFDDDSILRWDPTGVAMPVAPPAVADLQSVWVAYSRRRTPVCPVCGTYDFASLDIRDRQGGQILWIAREGDTLADIDPALENELFGVSVTTEPVCQVNGVAGCFEVRRRVFDHVIETVPAQIVHHATKHSVVTPGGKYEVFWALSEDHGTRIPQCNDGAAVASDTGFAASRISP